MSGHDREETLLGDLEITGRKEIGQCMKENVDVEEKMGKPGGYG